jgi:hypothetical protein
MTIWTAPFADGWNAEQNSRSDLGCGGGGTRTDPPTVRVLSDGQEIARFGGRAVGWISEDCFAYLLLDRPDLWGFYRWSGTVSPIAADADGNSLRAADGHWGSALVHPSAIGRVLYDGALLYSGAMWDGLALAGERLLHTVPDPTDGWPCLQEYVVGQKARRHRLPANGNAFTLHADGWIGAGYFGESWLLHPGLNTFDLVTVTPWRQEGPPTVALAPDGTPWLWTPTASPSGRLLVLGRPLGQTACVILELPATWLRVRILDGQWSIVAVDGAGQLRTARVPLDAPRQAVPWEPPAPDPVPPQPLPPVPPFPNPPTPPAPKPPVPPVPKPPVEEPRPMVYSNRPLFRDPSGWLPGTLTSVDGGVVVTDPDGNVLSVQPDGSYQTRPAGTAGPYEVAERAGPDLIFRPGGQIHVVATRG